MDISQLLNLIAPAVTFLAAKVGGFLREKVGDFMFVAIVVPAIGALVAYLTSLLVQTGNSWLVSFLLTLVATWLNEVVSKAQKAKVA